MAKELNLKNPMFKGQDAAQNSPNPMQAGILQYIDEVILSRNRNIDKSVNRRTLKSKIERKGENRNKGEGLSF
ncbi:hypothetical protein ACA086_03095 [Muriicola sp. E247]|uniref:hypothetical protein n=1 Tax=Muriicola sp. E247 TaxID=3242730 RepID=UPI003523ED1D